MENTFSFCLFLEAKKVGASLGDRSRVTRCVRKKSAKVQPNTFLVLRFNVENKVVEFRIIERHNEEN
jgi:hypothetical protein